MDQRRPAADDVEGRVMQHHVLNLLNGQILPVWLLQWRRLLAGRAALSAFPAG